MANEAHVRIVRAVSAVERLSEAPERAAIFLDVDGTLAPIAPRPEDARVPDEARAEVARLAERYALVACVSGRTGEDARRMVGVDGVRYVGAHGLELAPDADRWRDEIHSFAADCRLAGRGQGPDGLLPLPAGRGRGRAALEYLERGRGAGAPGGAHPALRPQGARDPAARPRGQGNGREADARRSRPPTRSLRGRRHAPTLDGFRALDGLELGVRVAVSSDEAPGELVRSRTSSSTLPRSFWSC